MRLKPGFHSSYQAVHLEGAPFPNCTKGLLLARGGQGASPVVSRPPVAAGGVLIEGHRECCLPSPLLGR